MTTLAFELTFPGVPTWNGAWDGKGRLYGRIRHLNKDKVQEWCEAHGINLSEEPAVFEYRWDDGWVANVMVSIVNSTQAHKLLRCSAGFHGYDWMIDSILKHGYICPES